MREPKDKQTGVMETTLRMGIKKDGAEGLMVACLFCDGGKKKAAKEVRIRLDEPFWVGVSNEKRYSYKEGGGTPNPDDKRIQRALFFMREVVAGEDRRTRSNGHLRNRIKGDLQVAGIVVGKEKNANAATIFEPRKGKAEKNLIPSTGTL